MLRTMQPQSVDLAFSSERIDNKPLCPCVTSVNNVFNGETLDIKDRYSFDFAPIRSQNEWETFLFKFWKDSEEFAYFIEQMPEKQLEQVFTDEKYGTYQRNIDAMIEHSYYHLGQIVLIKKIITGK